MSLARDSLRFAGLFEAEVLARLMLMQYSHPHAADLDFCNSLLESGTEVLQASVKGERLIDEIPPSKMNLVAAMWYAEVVAVSGDPSISNSEREKRQLWLDTIKRTFPSCFCDPDHLI